MKSLTASHVLAPLEFDSECLNCGYEFDRVEMPPGLAQGPHCKNNPYEPSISPSDEDVENATQN